MSRDEIVEAIEARWPGEDNAERLKGARAVSRSLNALNELGQRRRELQAAYEVNARRIEGAMLVAEGLSMREIGRRVGMSEYMVRLARRK